MLTTEFPGISEIMRTDVAMSRLRPLESALRRQGISALYLFGSVARGEAGEESDIDLAFDVGRDVRFSLFDQARIRNVIADTLDAKVDFVPLEGLRPETRGSIESGMVRVF